MWTQCSGMNECGWIFLVINTINSVYDTRHDIGFIFFSQVPISERSKLTIFGSNHHYLECIKAAHEFASKELVTLIKDKVINCVMMAASFDVIPRRYTSLTISIWFQYDLIGRLRSIKHYLLLDQVYCFYLWIFRVNYTFLGINVIDIFITCLILIIFLCTIGWFLGSLYGHFSRWAQQKSAWNICWKVAGTFAPLEHSQKITKSLLRLSNCLDSECICIYLVFARSCSTYNSGCCRSSPRGLDLLCGEQSICLLLDDVISFTKILYTSCSHIAFIS